jgi:hypothetical protein
MLAQVWTAPRQDWLSGCLALSFRSQYMRSR